jgi:hypothetical protein
MKIAHVQLKSTTPYSQARNIDKIEHPEKPKEGKDAYEERTWHHRVHTDARGYVEIPSTAFTSSVKQAARRLQIQVPGKGKTQYTKYFEAGIDVPYGLTLPVTKQEILEKRLCDRLFVPSDGKPGGGKRVYRTFPRIDSWSGRVTFFVLDDMIREDVFTQVLRSAGLLVGIGRFRPENRGFYGRFQVVSLEWIEDGDAVVGAASEEVR